MDAFLQGLLDWVHAHPAWAGAAVFLVAMSESLLVVGLVVPGTVLMFAIGALVGSGALGLMETLAWAFLGAVAGDGLSFWLGYHFRDRIRTWWPFGNHPELLARGEAFFHRHGGKSVLIGRFVGPVRPIIPAVAGMMGMSPGKFLAVNVLSAALWAPAYLLPGVAFGTSLTLASQVAARLAVFLALVVGGVWLSVWGVLRVYRWAAPRTGAFLARVRSRLARHPRLAPLAAALGDPQAPAARVYLLWGGGLAALSLSLTVAAPRWSPLERRWDQLMSALATPWGDRGMGHLAALAEPLVLLTLAAVALLWWWRRGERRCLRHALAGFAFVPFMATVLAWTAKPAVSVPLLGFTVIWGLTTVLAGTTTPRWRPLLYGLWAGLTATVAAARLYLGLEGPVQAALGVGIGLIWVALVGMRCRLRGREQARPELLALLTLVAMAVGTVWSVPAQRELPTPVVVDAQAWWNRLWSTLPPYRIDLGGEAEQPLTLQWGGTLVTLQDHLRRAGWRPAPPLNWRRLLNSFRAAPPVEELPVFPQLHEGRPEDLIMVFQDGSHDHRWVLRLWRSDLVLRGGGRVWEGYVARQRLAQPLSFLALARTEPRFTQARRRLAAQLTTLERKEVRRDEPASSSGNGWDGRVLLIRPRGNRP